MLPAIGRLPSNGNAPRQSGIIDYMSDKFPWSNDLEHKLRHVFKIEQFRFCQLG